MEPLGSISHSQGLFYNPVFSRIYKVPSIENYFLRIRSKIALPSTHLPIGFFPLGFPIKILIALLSSISTTCPAYLNLIDNTFIK